MTNDVYRVKLFEISIIRIIIMQRKGDVFILALSGQ